MEAKTQVPELVQQKLAEFEHIRPAFEDGFRFKQAVHGQKRFPTFSVGEIVSYFHALWLCECKDDLLSVERTMGRYEGRACLRLLQTWQEGQNAEVVAFLVHKLDSLPFADITAQLEESRTQQGDESRMRRLEHGRLILLNRSINFLHALETIFTLPADKLLAEVRSACEQYGHTPAQIEEQLREMETPLYSSRRHQLLAQQNMTLMNRLNIEVMTQLDRSLDERSWRITSSHSSHAPFAEQIIPGYVQLPDNVS